MNRKSKFAIMFYSFGTLIMIVMMAIVITNFKKDARMYKDYKSAVEKQIGQNKASAQKALKSLNIADQNRNFNK